MCPCSKKEQSEARTRASTQPSVASHHLSSVAPVLAERPPRVIATRAAAAAAASTATRATANSVAASGAAFGVAQGSFGHAE